MMLRKANRKPPARSASKPAAAKEAIKRAAKGAASKKAAPRAKANARRGKAKPWTADEIAEAFRRFRAANAEPKGELEHINPYTLLVAVVLSAQATDAGVNKATKALFALADTPEKMVALGVDKLQELIKTIGLYRNKAKNVIALSEQLIAAHDDRVPAVREALEQLPGVGRKTANVVLNIAFGEPTIAVDTHVFRVCNRTGLAPGATPVDVETRLEAVVPPDAKRYAHHWLILHGRYVCTAMRPRCPTCLINDLCRWEGKTIP
jgi:endonuclease-3